MGQSRHRQRKELGLEKSHANDAIAISGIEAIHQNDESCMFKHQTIS